MKTNFKSINILIFLAGFLATSCASGITLTVLDAETKKPIEGASCIAWWDIQRFDGSYDLAKIIEAKTDAKGKFKIPMVFGSKASKTPDIRIYKFGYAGWGRKYKFSGHNKSNTQRPEAIYRGDFKYKSQNVYLEKFTDEYSHQSHYEYLREYIPSNENIYSLEKRYFQFHEDIRKEKQFSKKTK